jgi:putative colanic acid biosysnthesis UDP-glucose lipid carrier transferase
MAWISRKTRSPWAGVLRDHARQLHRLILWTDPLLVMALFWSLVYHHCPSNLHGELGFVSTIVVGLCTALILPHGKLYQSYRQITLVALWRRLSTSWLLVLGALLALAFLTRHSTDYSRLNVTAWAVFTWGVLSVLHVGGRILLRWHRVHGGNARSILYWGLPEDAIDFYWRLHHNPYLGLRIAAWFSPQPPSPDQPLPPGMPHCSGHLPDVRRYLKSHTVDQIVFSCMPRSDISIQDLIRFFGDTCIPVVYAPTWVVPGMNFKVQHLGGQPCLDLWQPLDSILDRHLKRCFDVGVAGTAVLLLSPLMLLIALAICLTSPGPLFFLQDRYGLDGRRFRIYKFRTMRVLEAGDQKRLLQATRDDPRVTPVGALLRRWSLDELPQLFNVLQGQMSLVGPRPHAVSHNEQYRQLIPGYMQRHLFKPGMTGLAQVKGLRGEIESFEAMAHRVEADLEYQRDWTLAKDIKILIKTMLQIRSPKAY